MTNSKSDAKKCPYCDRYYYFDHECKKVSFTQTKPLIETPKVHSQYFVFVYYKIGDLKVLTLSESQSFHDSLIQQGYEHTATLDPCLWIRAIFGADNKGQMTNELTISHKKK